MNNNDLKNTIAASFGLWERPEGDDRPPVDDAFLTHLIDLINMQANVALQSGQTTQAYGDILDMIRHELVKNGYEPADYHIEDELLMKL